MKPTTLLALALLLGCSGASTETAASRTGGFRYIGRSAAGVPVLNGRIELAFPNDSTVTGTWAIGWIPGADTSFEVGPQVGTGTLVGRRMGDSLLIEMNPNWADNNVALKAFPSASGYTGQWTWSAFDGPRSGGSFTAGHE